MQLLDVSRTCSYLYSVAQIGYRDRFSFLLDFCCIIFFGIRQFRRVLLFGKYCEIIRLLKFYARLPNSRIFATHMEYSYFHRMLLSTYSVDVQNFHSRCNKPFSSRHLFHTGVFPSIQHFNEA